MKNQIKFILEECDFQTIHNIMTTMNLTWKFHNKPESVPTLEDIKEKSLSLLEEVSISTEDDDVISFSGLEAHKLNNVLELRFVPVRSNPLGNFFS